MEQPPSYHQLLKEAMNCLDYRLVHKEITFEFYEKAKSFIEFLSDGDYHLGDGIFIMLRDLRD